jgi:hypothetical protein
LQLVRGLPGIRYHSAAHATTVPDRHACVFKQSAARLPTPVAHAVPVLPLPSTPAKQQHPAASQPFTWIRAAGLRSIAEALSAGLEDGQALASVLEAVYSQGEWCLSTTCSLESFWSSVVVRLIVHAIIDGCTAAHSHQGQLVHVVHCLTHPMQCWRPS